MKKIFNTIIFILACMMSFSMLLKFIDYQIVPVVIIVTLGIASFLLDSFLEKELESSFGFMNLLSDRAHKSIRKLWGVSKAIMFILIYEIVGVDLIGLMIKTDGYEEKKLLFNAALFAVTLTGISIFISIFIRENFGEKFKLHRSLIHRFSIKVPSIWAESKIDKDNSRVFAYGDRINDSACYIFKDKKSSYDKDSSILDFGSLQLEVFKAIEDINVVDTSEVCVGYRIYYSHEVLINKKKYKAFQYFTDNKENYYEVRIIVQSSYYNEQEVKEMITSFSV
ncbi:MAG: hypothetical protein K8R73_11595 [Clostridiales bacterium]|nr:hypothetical protein [Clostridiales bacterium]